MNDLNTQSNIEKILQEHNDPGVDILLAEPSKLIKRTISVIVLMLASVLVWSFIGRIDLVVSTKGVYSPESEVRRVFAPVGGELVDIFVAEGMPVSKGDVLFRIDAQGVVNAATEALKAKLKLVEAEREHHLLPIKKKAMALKRDALKIQIRVEEKKYQRRISEDLTKLANEQTIKLEKLQAKLKDMKRKMVYAKKEAEKYERLLKLPGGGGVSRQQSDAKQNEHAASQTRYQLVESELGELELKFNSEYFDGKIKIESANQTLMELRAEYETAADELSHIEEKSETKLKVAKLTAEAASRVRFDNIDEDNFLLVLSPISGVITSVEQTQPGDKTEAKRPLAGIAEMGVRNVLEIEIEDKDRGFLREGQQVKMKFNAFPYQRHGFISGTLNYISLTTSLANNKNKRAAYKGRVLLDKEYFEVGSIKHPIRYGMTASAEIVIRKRRLIDLALDPLRKLDI